jgi:hypothetical protein
MQQLNVNCERADHADTWHQGASDYTQPTLGAVLVADGVLTDG